jgi:hypothetical protein
LHKVCSYNEKAHRFRRAHLISLQLTWFMREPRTVRHQWW